MLSAFPASGREPAPALSFGQPGGTFRSIREVSPLPEPAPSATASAAIGFVIDRLEGGAQLVTDSGGLTRFGISRKAHPTVDVEHLTREGALAIYARDYWAPVWGDEHEPGLALALFDAAVNQGVAVAIKQLQAVLGVAADGRMGPATVGAARRYLPASELRARYLELRLRTYEDLVRSKPVYTQYLHGWRLRVMRVADEAGRVGRS